MPLPPTGHQVATISSANMLSTRCTYPVPTRQCTHSPAEPYSLWQASVHIARAPSSSSSWYHITTILPRTSQCFSIYQHQLHFSFPSSHNPRVWQELALIYNIIYYMYGLKNTAPQLLIAKSLKTFKLARPRQGAQIKQRVAL